jgi:hypothetical protein
VLARFLPPFPQLFLNHVAKPGHRIVLPAGAATRRPRPSHPGSHAAHATASQAPPMEYRLRRELDPSAKPRNAPDVPLGDPCRAAVTACIKVALAIMRSDKGFKALLKTGEDTHPVVQPTSRLSCFDTSRLQDRAGSFLNLLSKGFVPVTLTNRTNPADRDMWFERADWPRTPGYWKADAAGTMYLSKVVRCLPFPARVPRYLSRIRILTRLRQQGGRVHGEGRTGDQ